MLWTLIHNVLCRNVLFSCAKSYFNILNMFAKNHENLRMIFLAQKNGS